MGAAGIVWKILGGLGIAYSAGSTVVNASSAETKGDFTATAGGGVLDTVGTIATTVAPFNPYGYIAMAAGFGLKRTAISHWSEMGQVFNPSMDTKRHMIGLASGQFHKELVDPKTDRIDWGNMATLDKYQELLKGRIDKLKYDIGQNDSWIPDGMRATNYLGLNPNGMAEADKQENRKSDLKIAESAFVELQDQKRLVQEYREAQTAISKLTGGEIRELTIADLNRNGNKTIDQEDLATIRATVGDEKAMKLLLESLQQSGITFQNQSIPELQAAQPQLASSPKEQTSSQGGGLWNSITNFFAGIVAMITSVFGGGKDAQQIADAGGAAAPARAMTQQTSCLPEPLVALAQNNLPMRQKSAQQAMGS